MTSEAGAIPILHFMANLPAGRNAWKGWLAIGIFLAGSSLSAQRPTPPDSAGHVPVVSGGMGYVHNVNGGATTLEPQIDPVLLVPFGQHVLLESRTDFTGVFQRKNATTGPFQGKVFKNVEYAQVDWLADSHAIVTAGKYLLPFGLFNERLEPIWIRTFQDPPIDAPIGTRTSGAGDGLMLRGVLKETSIYSIQYSSYFSARSGINQLEAARTAGGDGSVFFPGARIEAGASYQRFLQKRRINSVATYLSWQPPATELDIKLEYDRSYYGHGYWLQAADRLEQTSLPGFLKHFQPAVRVQQFAPLHGGGNGTPSVRVRRFDAGLNYYFRDNLRLISSYGRQFSSPRNANVWNGGITYRFLWPLWPGRKP